MTHQDSGEQSTPSVSESADFDEALWERGESIGGQQAAGRRLFRARGTFAMHRTRPNIAIAQFYFAGYTHPDDDRNAARNLRQTRRNLAAAGVGRELGDGDMLAGRSEGVNHDTFAPAAEIVVKRITVSVTGLPIENHEYILGDNCVYLDQSLSLHDIRKPRTRVLPHQSEMHCTATSIWGQDRYTRSLSLPDGLGMRLPAGETISCPTHFALVAPDELDPAELKSARAAFTIEYELAGDGPVQKLIRIPYLDQYPDAPELIRPDRPWYQAWDRKVPLVVRGFSAYFSPKPIRDQVLEDLCIYAVDEHGRRVPGKEIALPDQRYVTGNTHLTLEPAFQEGYFEVEPGEYLSASANLVEGNLSADCAFFVLVDVPEHKRDKVMAAPLYHSDGVANLDYVRGQYRQDRSESQSTPAAKQVLRAIITTHLKPWRDLMADLAPDATADEQLDFATQFIFVD